MKPKDVYHSAGRLWIVTAFLLISQLVSAQLFVDINAGLTGLTYSSAEWGDFDDDKDLDLLVAGIAANGTYRSIIYENENGIFTDIQAGLEGFQKGSVNWVDYDRDGDLDILLAGESLASKTILYRNDDGQFTDTEAGIDYFGAFGAGVWGDYDQDGDLDLFISGNWSSKIYRNDGGDVFTDIEAGIIPLSSTRADWGDYDFDGDLDLIVAGDTGGGMIVFIMKNEEGDFQQYDLSIQGLSAGSVEWGDYDNDGDADILIMGFDDYVEPHAEIYRNDGNGVYTSIFAGLAPVSMGRATWGDYENDGDLDVLITGKISGCGTFTSAVYENLGGDIFTELTSSGLAPAQNSYAAWGDYDGDMDLDIVLLGDGNGNPFSKVYRNEGALPNSQPGHPENLAAQQSGNEILLTWDEASDNETPSDALSYNIRIGGAPGACDVLSPMAHVSDGFRKVVRKGNAGFDNSFRILDLDDGTYFWSVQTIDNSFASSDFAPEQSFTVGLTGIESLASGKQPQIYPNPATDHIIFSAKDDQPVYKQYSLLNSLGREVMKGSLTGYGIIDVSELQNGIYFLRIADDRNVSVHDLIISR